MLFKIFRLQEIASDLLKLFQVLNSELDIEAVKNNREQLHGEKKPIKLNSVAELERNENDVVNDQNEDGPPHELPGGAHFDFIFEMIVRLLLADFKVLVDASSTQRNPGKTGISCLL